MGEQLDLFGGPPRRLTNEPFVLDTTPGIKEPAAPAVLPGQLSIFDDRWQHAQAAHRALASFDLDGAMAALQILLDPYPLDASLRDRHDVIARVAARLKEQAHTPFSQALLSVRDAIPQFMLNHWQMRVASALAAEPVEGEHAGAYLLAAGDARGAEASLRAHVASTPTDALAQIHLANALCALSRVTEARVIFRDVFASVPSPALFERVKDPAFVDLMHRAQDDFDIEGDATPWLAVIGVVTGFFQYPGPPAAREQPSLDSLSPGLRAYHLVTAERHARTDVERIEWRRKIKAAHPALLAQLLSQGR